MIWQKALKTLLLSKDRNGTPFVIPLIAGAFLFPAILIVALFSPGSSASGYSDPFLEGYKELKCIKGQEYQLEDVRAYETYLNPNVMDKLTKEKAAQKLKDIYFNISSDKDGKNCFLKSDDEIIRLLSKNHTLSNQQEKEMLQDVEALRNGRENFQPPLKEADSIEMNDNDLQYQVNKNSSVYAIGTGTVVDKKYDPDEIVVEDCTSDKCEEKKIPKGNTVVIKHELQKGINESGEYDTETIYSEYACLNTVQVSKGDHINLGQKIGRVNTMLFVSMRNDSHIKVNPRRYFNVPITYGDLISPLKNYVVTSDFGKRDIEGNEFHYGIDLVDKYGSEIRAAADGKIISVDAECDPDGGYLGNMCPASLHGAGNYVQEEIQLNGKKYILSYLHMEKVNVKLKQHVNVGDVIGTQGHSGNSTGSHLHFEIHEKTFFPQTVGTPIGIVDPNTMIKFKK